MVQKGLGGTTRLLDGVRVELLPRHKEADEEGNTAKRNGDGEGELDAGHVGDQDAWYVRLGKYAADVGRACNKELRRVDGWGCLRDTLEETVDER